MSTMMTDRPQESPEKTSNRNKICDDPHSSNVYMNDDMCGNVGYPSFSRLVFPIAARARQILSRGSISLSPASPPSPPLSVHPGLAVTGL
ncbi:hypothetical protein CCH79_00007566 [Gambusia affinis]|uniref:Uncharacterized protein n=1 Tax=Gambusia affinis TaxID=33528 RepID=A0A315WDA1_GAMAF|nr:hypothetical protein CCH79_00007566 [Gambusia affinis]